MFAKLAQSLWFGQSACGAVSANRRAWQRQSSRPSLGHHLAARAPASPCLWLATGTCDRPARMFGKSCRSKRRWLKSPG
jgi:hypothetical protein